VISVDFLLSCLGLLNYLPRQTGKGCNGNMSCALKGCVCLHELCVLHMFLVLSCGIPPDYEKHATYKFSYMYNACHVFDDLHNCWLIVAIDHIHHQSVSVMQIHVIEYWRGNEKWTMQKNINIYRVHKTKKNNAKTQRNMCWTPLYANSMLSAVSHATKWDGLITAPTGITYMSG